MPKITPVVTINRIREEVGKGKLMGGSLMNGR